MSIDFRSGIRLNGQQLSNLGSPTVGTDAANKQYVDNVAAGLDVKPSVKAASTANLTLSGTQTVDGVSLAVGDRVLAKDQTTASANGIYIVASGAWTRAADASQGQLTPGALVIVEQGSNNADTLWILTTDGAITVGTTALAFTKFQAGVTYSFGNGLTLSAGTVSVNAGAGLLVDGTSLRVDPAYSGFMKRFAATLSGTATSGSITHGLNTLDITSVQWYDISGANRQPVDVDWVLTDANTLAYTFGSAPTAGQYRIVASA